MVESNQNRLERVREFLVLLVADLTDLVGSSLLPMAVFCYVRLTSGIADMHDQGKPSKHSGFSLVALVLAVITYEFTNGRPTLVKNF